MDKIILISDSEYNANKRLEIEGIWSSYDEYRNLCKIIVEFFTCDSGEVFPEEE